MTNQIIPFGSNPREQAIQLLAAAEELGQPPEIVQTREGAFYAPAEVIEKAGLIPRPDDEPTEPDDNPDEPDGEPGEPEEPVTTAEAVATDVHTVNDAAQPEKAKPKRGGRRTSTQE